MLGTKLSESESEDEEMDDFYDSDWRSSEAHNDHFSEYLMENGDDPDDDVSLAAPSSSDEPIKRSRNFIIKLAKGRKGKSVSTGTITAPNATETVVEPNDLSHMESFEIKSVMTKPTAVVSPCDPASNGKDYMVHSCNVNMEPGKHGCTTVIDPTTSEPTAYTQPTTTTDPAASTRPTATATTMPTNTTDSDASTEPASMEPSGYTEPTPAPPMAVVSIMNSSDSIKRYLQMDKFFKDLLCFEQISKTMNLSVADLEFLFELLHEDSYFLQLLKSQFSSLRVAELDIVLKFLRERCWSLTVSGRKSVKVERLKSVFFDKPSVLCPLKERIKSVSQVNLADLAVALKTFDISLLNGDIFERVIYSRPIIKGETSVTVFPQDATAVKKWKDEKWIIKGLAINCQVLKTCYNNLHSHFWNSRSVADVTHEWPTTDEVVLRVISSNTSSSLGFVVFCLFRPVVSLSEGNRDDILRSLYHKILVSYQDYSCFPESSATIDGFFRIPALEPYNDSLEMIISKARKLSTHEGAPYPSSLQIVTFLNFDGSRIVHPIKSTRCNHFQCFSIDLLQTLVHCPSCHVPLTTEMLCIDVRFLKVLSKYPSDSGCVFNSDGSDKALSDSDKALLPVFGVNDKFFPSDIVVSLRQTVVDTSYKILVEPIRLFTTCFFHHNCSFHVIDLKLDEQSKLELSESGVMLIIIGLSKPIYSSTWHAVTRKVSGTVSVDSGSYAVFVAKSFSIRQILKRGYHLALPSTELELTLSIADLPGSNEMYKVPDKSLQELREKVLGSPMGMAHSGHEVVTLNWPGMGRIQHPTRGDKCQHAQCFDLEEVLEACFSKYDGQLPVDCNTLYCPVCGNMIDIHSLKIDGFFLSLLDKYASDGCVIMDGIDHALTKEDEAIQWKISPPGIGRLLGLLVKTVSVNICMVLSSLEKLNIFKFNKFVSEVLTVPIWNETRVMITDEMVKRIDSSTTLVALIWDHKKAAFVNGVDIGCLDLDIESSLRDWVTSKVCDKSIEVKLTTLVEDGYFSIIQVERRDVDQVWKLASWPFEFKLQKRQNGISMASECFELLDTSTETFLKNYRDGCIAKYSTICTKLNSDEIVTFSWPGESSIEKIKHAVKSIKCKHAQCFDLFGFWKTLATRDTRIICPVCSTSFQFYELIYDPFFMNLLNKYPTADGCYLTLDGVDKSLSPEQLDYLPLFVFSGSRYILKRSHDRMSPPLSHHISKLPLTAFLNLEFYQDIYSIATDTLSKNMGGSVRLMSFPNADRGVLDKLVGSCGYLRKEGLFRVIAFLFRDQDSNFASLDGLRLNGRNHYSYRKSVNTDLTSMWPKTEQVDVDLSMLSINSGSKGYISFLVVRGMELQDIIKRVYLNTLCLDLSNQYFGHGKFCLQLERPKMTVQTLVSALKETASNDSRAKICDTDDIEVGDESVSFRCPLSLCRIQHPGRGKKCTHSQCFDLESMFSCASEYESFVCVCCNQSIQAADLIVDRKFILLLEKYPDDDGCIVEIGGGDRKLDASYGTSRIAEESGPSDVIDLCSDEDSCETSTKRKPKDLNKARKKPKIEDDVIVIE